MLSPNDTLLLILFMALYVVTCFLSRDRPDLDRFSFDAQDGDGPEELLFEGDRAELNAFVIETVRAERLAKAQLADVSAVGLKLAEDVKARDVEIDHLQAQLDQSRTDEASLKRAIAGRDEEIRGWIRTMNGRDARIGELETIIVRGKSANENLIGERNRAIDQLDDANAAARKAQDEAKLRAAEVKAIDADLLESYAETEQLRRIVGTVARIVNDSTPTHPGRNLAEAALRASVAFHDLAESMPVPDAQLRRAYFDDADQVADLG